MRRLSGSSHPRQEDGMRRMAMAIGSVVAAVTLGSVALADSTPFPSQAAPAAQSSVAVPCGVAVVGFPGAIDSAWALAGAVYAQESLSPCSIGEAQPRVPCRAAPPNGAPAQLRELAD